MTERIERFVYDDAIVRKFLLATLVWGLVGMLVGLVDRAPARQPRVQPRAAVDDLRPPAPAAHQRRDLRVRGQRHLHRRLLLVAAPAQGADVERPSEPHPLLGLAGASSSRAAITLPLGLTRRRSTPSSSGRSTSPSRSCGWSSRSTCSARRPAARAAPVRRDLVLHRDAVAIAMLHIFNSLDVVAGPFKSYSIYAGVQDAFMQWWYGHNAVAFFLTTPFLGIMYYFLPKAASGRSSRTGCRSSTSGRSSSSTSGRVPTTCTTRRCPRGRRRSACCSR